MCRKRFAEPKIFTTFVVPTSEYNRNITPIIRRVKKFEGLFYSLVGTSDFFYALFSFNAVATERNGNRSGK